MISKINSKITAKMSSGKLINLGQFGKANFLEIYKIKLEFNETDNF